jgi:hypothetical protein
MKPSFAAAMAATLWAAVAQAQVLPSSGPDSKIPVGPDDTPLIRRADHRIAIELTAGAPGPFLPNPGDPTKMPSAPGYSPE